MAWLVKVDKNGTKYFADNKCRKCGGTGYIHGYEHIDGARCWDCGATGIENTYTWKEYTPEYAEKLAARRKAKAIKEAPERNRKFFENYGLNADGRTWLVIGNTYEIKDELKAAGAKFNNLLGWHFDRAENGFNCFEIYIADVGHKNDVGEWHFNDTCEIDELIAAKRAEHAPKTASEYVGKLGEKFEGVLTFKGVFKYKTHFTYYGETNYIYKFADKNGNTIVWKTSTFHNLNDEEKYTVKGTIKEHSEYKGDRQTILTRCKIG